MLIVLMESCMIFVRARCDAPGRQQDETTNEANAPNKGNAIYSFLVYREA